MNPGGGKRTFVNFFRWISRWTKKPSIKSSSFVGTSSTTVSESATPTVAEYYEVCAQCGRIIFVRLDAHYQFRGKLYHDWCKNYMTAVARRDVP